MDKNERNLNKTIVLSVKLTICEIIVVDIAILFVVVMFFYAFYRNIVKNRWYYHACITSYCYFCIFYCFLQLSADIILLFHLVISSVDSVRWNWNLDSKHVLWRSFILCRRKLYNGSKFYCYKGLNITHCFEYNSCFRGEDYIFSLEAKYFGILDKFWLRKHRSEKIAAKLPREPKSRHKSLD